MSGFYGPPSHETCNRVNTGEIHKTHQKLQGISWEQLPPGNFHFTKNVVFYVFAPKRLRYALVLSQP